MCALRLSLPDFQRCHSHIHILLIPHAVDMGIRVEIVRKGKSATTVGADFSIRILLASPYVCLLSFVLVVVDFVPIYVPRGLCH